MSYDEPCNRTRILIADDHAMVAQGLRAILCERFAVIDVVFSAQALVNAVYNLGPDLVVSDIDLGDSSGIDTLAKVRSAGIRVPVVFVTMHAADGLVRAALDVGASGYVLKTDAGEELITAIRWAQAGRCWVSPRVAHRTLLQSGRVSMITARQRSVLKRLAAGQRAKQIGFELGLSTRTVEAHKYALMQIFDAHTSLELVIKARNAGYLVGTRDPAEINLSPTLIDVWPPETG